MENGANLLKWIRVLTVGWTNLTLMRHRALAIALHIGPCSLRSSGLYLMSSRCYPAPLSLSASTTVLLLT